jgi:cell shape-determining protein MreC
VLADYEARIEAQANDVRRLKQLQAENARLKKLLPSVISRSR